MGITGLLPFLKGKEGGGATRAAHLREFAGSTAVIDVYCWLHKVWRGVVWCVVCGAVP